MELPIRLHDYDVLIEGLQPGSVAHQARAILRQVLQDAGVATEDIDDAELAVGELAANAETHACPPYELRIVSVNGIPTWCEIVDGDPCFTRVAKILRDLNTADPLTRWFQESGRGLLLVHQLSGARCVTYLTRSSVTGCPSKAVTFALPAKSSPTPDTCRTMFSLRP
ncbi:ATP-binding protein [Nonomuraea glycinis]|uniref:Histidine kinase/HSP90-like ATPase domain-containing protein n=1 Tax=Nonomuraea glycinis TaxID=2047744 RepID=A0A918A6S8_9ACTN|nr:ATP-binding protein [Nonomuraea glycinis]MCA2178996.1 ATP-binding protein [Nonomuraea glycinis]GGP08467.1 hypothetical protein GCM10012278_40300 [Nonomuraea glycinis]